MSAAQSIQKNYVSCSRVCKKCRLYCHSHDAQFYISLLNYMHSGERVVSQSATHSYPSVASKEEQTVLDESFRHYGLTPNKGRKNRGAGKKREGQQQQASCRVGRKAKEDRSKENKADDKTMPISLTVDWNTHCLLQKLSENSTEVAVCEGDVIYEEVKQQKECCQTDEHTYQPLLPPRRLEGGGGVGGEEAGPYQSLTLEA